MATGGPITTGGKAAISRKARKHGLLLTTPVVAGVETPEAWQAHLSSTLESLQPEGHLEMVLAERVALNLWRLARVARVEAAQMTRSTQELVNQMRGRWPSSLPVPPIINHPGGPERCIEHLRSELHTLQGFFDLPEDEPVMVDCCISLEGIVYECGARAANAPLPDYRPEPDWARGLALPITVLRTEFGRIAQGFRVELRLLIEQATAMKQADFTTAQIDYDLLQESLARQHLRDLLPRASDVACLVRYESHLNRQLLTAMHELEALQTRRQGRSAPLARIDVSSACDT